MTFEFEDDRTPFEQMALWLAKQNVTSDRFSPIPFSPAKIAGLLNAISDGPNAEIYTSGQTREGSCKCGDPEPFRVPFEVLETNTSEKTALFLSFGTFCLVVVFKLPIEHLVLNFRAIHEFEPQLVSNFPDLNEVLQDPDTWWPSLLHRKAILKNFEPDDIDSVFAYLEPGETD